MILPCIKRSLALHLGLAVAFPILLPLTGRAGDQLTEQPPLPPPVTKMAEANFLSFWDGRLVIDIEERVCGDVRDNTRDSDSRPDSNLRPDQEHQAPNWLQPLLCQALTSPLQVHRPMRISGTA